MSAGQNIVYTVTIHNGGPSDAQAISFIDTLPAGTTFVTAFQTIGSTFALTTPPVDGTGTVSGTTATIFSTDDAIFVIVVKVNPGTPDGTVLTNTATATTVTSDPTPGNNTSTVSTTVMTTPPTSCDTYAATTSTGNAIVPGTNFIANSNCDDCSNPITLPFSFSYYGTPFTTANVISNGSLQFGSSDTTFTNTCLPVPGFNNAIVPHWDDLLLTGAGQGTFTSVTGSAPFRVFNIEWRGGYFSGVGAVDFEIRLYETTNQIDFVYGSVPQGGASATVGLQKGTGTVFSQFSCNTVSLSDGLKITYKCPNAASCNENFDTVVAPALPPGWTSTATGAEVPWVTSTTNPDTAPNDAFAPDPNAVGNTELITPRFIVSAGGSGHFPELV